MSYSFGTLKTHHPCHTSSNKAKPPTTSQTVPPIGNQIFKPFESMGIIFTQTTTVAEDKLKVSSKIEVHPPDTHWTIRGGAQRDLGARQMFAEVTSKRRFFFSSKGESWQRKWEENGVSAESWSRGSGVSAQRNRIGQGQ